LDFGEEKSWTRIDTNETGCQKSIELSLKPYETAMFKFE
jgi:hypothetical protein